MSNDEGYAERPIARPGVGRPGVAKAAPVKAAAKKAPPTKAAALKRPPVKGVAKRPVETDASGKEYDDEPSEQRPTKAPAKKAGAKKAGGGKGLAAGWGAARRAVEATSTYAQSFVPDGTTRIVKFLEDEPYASFNRHWVERNTPGGKSNRPFTCLASPGIDQDCPLCDIGERAVPVVAFNVAVVESDGTVALRSWDAGAKIKRQLEGFGNDPKIGPLTKRYYAVDKSGKGNASVTNIVPVRAEFLEEDYGIDLEPDQEVYDALQLYDGTIIELPKVRQLEELALELSESEDD